MGPGPRFGQVWPRVQRLMLQPDRTVPAQVQVTGTVKPLTKLTSRFTMPAMKEASIREPRLWTLGSEDWPREMRPAQPVG